MASVFYENNHAIVGSWYPTSFHGHFRNRPRTEYSIPYRQRAKPAPPQKFLDHCKQRSNAHPFSQHDNRHAHSDRGNLESYFGMGLGKRKNSSSHHYKNTRELLMWSDKKEPFLSTYRSQFSPASPPPKATCNTTEPLHVRSNLGVQRRQLRVRSTPAPRAQTASLLAWNTTDEFINVKPLVGSRTNRFADHTTSQRVRSTGTLIPPTLPVSTSQSSVVSETVTPLNRSS